MFYQYSTPIHFYQHLHNILASVIIKTGQILALLLFKPSSGGHKFTSFSNPSLIWSLTVTTFQIPVLIYMPYYINFVKEEEPKSNDISDTLVSISDIFYNGAAILIYGIAFFQRKLIFKLFSISKLFLNECRKYAIVVEDDRKCFVFYLATKMILDLCIALPAIYMYINYFVMHPTILSFLYTISQPTAMVVYSFTITVYYISFAFGLFYVKILSANVNDKSLHSISYWYQEIHKYLRKVKGLLEFVIFLLLFENFIGLVGEVSIIIISRTSILRSCFFSDNSNAFTPYQSVVAPI